MEAHGDVCMTQGSFTRCIALTLKVEPELFLSTSEKWSSGSVTTSSDATAWGGEDGIESGVMSQVEQCNAAACDMSSTCEME